MSSAKSLTAVVVWITKSATCRFRLWRHACQVARQSDSNTLMERLTSNPRSTAAASGSSLHAAAAKPVRPIRIRPMTQADTPAVANLLGRAFDAQTGRTDFIPPGARIACTQRMRYTGPALVAEELSEEGGAIILGSVFNVIWGGCGGFGPLSVEPMAQGRGIAQKLLDASFKIFDEQGVQHIEIFTFLPTESSKHHHLYNKYGLIHTFEIKVMELILAEWQQRAGQLPAAPYSEQYRAEAWSAARGGGGGPAPGQSTGPTNCGGSVLRTSQESSTDVEDTAGAHVGQGSLSNNSAAQPDRRAREAARHLTQTLHPQLDMWGEVCGVTDGHVSGVVIALRSQLDIAGGSAVSVEQGAGDCGAVQALEALAVVHIGEFSEAGLPGRAYLKYAVARSEAAFERVVHEVAVHCAAAGAKTIEAGCTVARVATVEKMLELGFKVLWSKASMQRPGLTGQVAGLPDDIKKEQATVISYNRPDVYFVGDHR